MKFASAKDPDDILDYVLDWSNRLNDDDTIITSTFTITDSVSLAVRNSTISTDGKKTTVWLTAGADGETASVRNRVTTAAGRQMDQTVQLKIKTR